MCFDSASTSVKKKTEEIHRADVVGLAIFNTPHRLRLNHRYVFHQFVFIYIRNTINVILFDTDGYTVS